jgi:predicted DNA-binding transcriptional regulator AlpA
MEKMKPTVTLPAFMDQKTVATYVGKSCAWFERARMLGEGPRFVKLGRHVRYRAEDILDWIKTDCHSKEEGP